MHSILHIHNIHLRYWRNAYEHVCSGRLSKGKCIRTQMQLLAYKGAAKISIWRATGFMTCTAADHQGMVETFWLLFCGAVMLSIFLYSDCASNFFSQVYMLK